MQPSTDRRDNAGETKGDDKGSADGDTPVHPLQAAPPTSTVHESCSICIEEFAVDDIVRVLPSCRHVFHSACIDPWLTATSALCPLCKADTRTPSEIAHFDSRCKSILDGASASVDVNVNRIQITAQHFDDIIDAICLTRNGSIIKRTRPVTIRAHHTNSAIVLAHFTTTKFIRAERRDSEQASWWSKLTGRVHTMAQSPECIEISMNPTLASQRNQQRQTAYPPRRV
ncbi:hypothetical protein GQ42DRAFT_125382 [Ramicandelaber brevisporus]|nr:hypothetical protein GQ42DRAFT_125382 [Ramicandelaber brevisporus]